jgi:hypothetical protein
VTSTPTVAVPTTTPTSTLASPVEAKARMLDLYQKGSTPTRRSVIRRPLKTSREPSRSKTPPSPTGTTPRPTPCWASSITTT